MADKFKWYAQKDGEVYEGSCRKIQEITGLNEYKVNRSMNDGRRYNGWLIYREAIDYENAIYDIVDDDNNIIFSGNEEQIERHFKFKMLKIKSYLDGRMLLKKKYRVFRQNEFNKPKYHPESVDIATMLKIHGNTIANGRTLERSLNELKQMGIKVDIEKSAHWKNWYVLTRRDNAEARS